MGSFFFRRLNSPQIMPTNITNTIKIPKAIMPVISAIYSGSGVGDGIGVVFSLLAAWVVFATEGVNPKDSFSGSAAVLEGFVKTKVLVGVADAMATARAGVKARKVPIKKETATRITRRIMIDRGR